VTLTFMGITYWLVPFLWGRGLWSRGLALTQVWLPPHDPLGAAAAETAMPLTERPVLEFPLRGEWRVFQPPGHPREAFDFVAVDATRRRYVSGSWLAFLLGAGPITDWYGWSQPVYAPFEGTVTAASDGQPDRETVNLLRDLVRPFLFPPKIAGEDIRPFAGNHVIIRSGPVAALLAHLRRDSVKVAVGQHVTPDDVVGEVGNSGNSLAPHLHLQLMDSADPRQGRLLAFRFRRYALWNGMSWETVWDRAPTGGERIRSVAARSTASVTSILR
jgi:murein DD-endopeptidase MepM/ murein hydrolase activator NlpD